MDPDQLESGLAAQGIDRARPVVACCISDERNSSRAARRLLALGYSQVCIVKGGLGGWSQAGLPLESKPLGD